MEAVMFKKSEFLKSKDTLLKVINISGFIFILGVILLVGLGIGYGYQPNNKDIKNSLIAFGAIDIAIYLIQLIPSIYLFAGYVKVLKQVKLRGGYMIKSRCFWNMMTVMIGLGGLCFGFTYKIKMLTMDVSDTYMNTTLNNLVTLDLPYYERDNGTLLLDAQSYNFDNTPLNIQESPADPQ